MKNLEEGRWKINIPEKYHVGHEAHFAQVTEKYLRYLIDGKLPALGSAEHDRQILHNHRGPESCETINSIAAHWALTGGFIFQSAARSSRGLFCRSHCETGPADLFP